VGPLRVPPSPCPCHSNPPGDSVATSVGSEALGAHCVCPLRRARCHSNPPGDSVAASVGIEALGAHCVPGVLGFLYRRDLYADVTFMLVVGTWERCRGAGTRPSSSLAIGSEEERAYVAAP
jgi:hypothetical protein